MIFASFDFIFFIIFFILILKLIQNKSENFKKSYILISSYFFYGYWDWRFLGLIWFVTFINYYASALINKEETQHKDFWLLISLISCLCLLGFFKYYNFFIDSIKVFLPLTHDPLQNLNIILPLGISFFTFQAMGYTIDVHRKKIKPAGKLDFFLFVAFFPQLLSGPINRADLFFPQLKNKIILNKKNFNDGLSLFIVGFFKKSLLADSLSIFVNEVFGHISIFNWSTVLAAVIAYTLQIYFDFSGYSDMAIGIGKIIGFKLPDNFNKPYKSINIAEFWRRWHISLSTWFRDYLYIALGGNRKGAFRSYFNLLVTMVLCGMWHGASWNFIFWGFYHGLLLIVHRLFTAYKNLIHFSFYKNQLIKNLFNFFSISLTFILVAIGWVPFRANNFEDTYQVFNKIILLGQGIFWIHISFYIILPCCIIYYFIKDTDKLKDKLIGFDNVTQLTVTMAILMLVLLFSPIGNSPFIYFQF